MSKLQLRPRTRISYCEYEEPNLDEYVFCEKCGDYVYEYCSIHGALLVVPDDKVPAKPPFPSFVPRAALTIPKVFLHLARSTIPNAGLGVFTTLTLPRGVRFGPYGGKRTEKIDSMYCWQLHDGNNKWSHVIDAADPNSSNWMRYVNCPRHWCEQNLVAYQYQGQIYYRTIRTIPRYTELMVFYGGEFARLLNIDLRLYNRPSGYAQMFGAAPANKRKQDKNKAIAKRSEAINELVNIKTPLKNTVKKEEPNDKKEDKKKIPIFKKGGNKFKTPLKTILKETETTTSNIISKKLNESAFIKNDSVTPPKDIFTCEVCKNEYQSKTVLKNHIKKSHLIELNRNANSINSELEVTNECKSTNVLEIQEIQNNDNLTATNKCRRDIKKRSKGKQYECSYCVKRFTSSSSLSSHLRIHTKQNLYKCDICQKCFTVSSSLTIHLRIHSGEKPYSCSYCDNRFTRNGDLTQHLRVHTKEKPFKCDICEKYFNQSSNLTRHLRIHSGEKPYSCSYCDNRFTRNGELTQHLRVHTKEKPFKCDICEKYFNQSSNLTRHLRIHSGEKPYSCSYCDKRFTVRSNLNAHLRIHAKENH